MALTSTAQAGYRIVIPMEQSRGGALPNGTINITPRTPGLPAENWQPAEPTYSDWVNSGAIYGCTFSPAPATIEGGITFTQSAMGCSQDQTRLKQEREQEVTTLVYRIAGEAILETRKEGNLTATRLSTGTMDCWYADNEYAMKVSGTNWLFKLNGSWYPNIGTTPDGYYYSGWYYYSGSYVGLANGETRHKICRRL